MILTVDKANERAWAELCVALWPEAEADALLRSRAGGGFRFEYIYYHTDKAVAFLSLSLRHDYVEGTTSSPVGYIEGIYVRPEHRGKGIARRLIAHAKAWAIEHGCSELASDTALENTDGRAFHHRVGFCEANTVVCFTMRLR